MLSAGERTRKRGRDGKVPVAVEARGRDGEVALAVDVRERDKEVAAAASRKASLS